MSILNRLFNRDTDGGVLRTFLLGASALVLSTFSVTLGLVVLAVFVMILCLGRTTSSAQHWVPNVRGENPYQILGVTQDADTATIRRAFRELERIHHPDAVPDDQKAEATALFVRINQAYELLSDTEKRYEYDHLLSESECAIPPFDEAFRQIKDVDKHEMYAAFDELHPSAPSAPPEIAASPAPMPTPSEPVAPVEVELPDSVREALGLSLRPDPLTGREGTDDRLG
ncbi:MAG: hypothetical protein C0467_24340 [Planctomycetaceae bacterium]|nr:hypothetical protein [Planctomycetaceae bacterium]